MKRKVLLLALLVITALLLMAGVALGETDPIVCSMEVSPSKLSAPGPVNVTITISNSGDTDMQDPLMLYNPVSQLVDDFGTNGAVLLKAGEVKTWTGTWDVNQRTLENGSVVFFVKYTLYRDSGESYSQSQPIRGKIGLQTAEADMDVKRTITPGTARQGQAVTVKYDIMNTGTIVLKNISIKENKDINKTAQTIAELKPGETAQITFPVTMGKKNLTSSATITFITESSSKKQTRTVDEQVITYGEPAMTAQLTASAKGVQQNGTVTLSLSLKNNGNVDYSDLRVTDNTIGDVFTNQKLDKGGTLKLDKEITLTETTEYQFTITAIDNTGTEVSLATDPVTVTAVDPGKMLHLTLTASSDRTEVYEQPGQVRFAVTVENDSEVDAKDVTVYHGETRIYTFASIPAGESRSLTRDAALSMAGKYQFTARTTDDLGNSVSFASNEIQIAFSVPTPAPATATPPPVPTAEPTYAVITPVPVTDPSVGAVPKVIRSIVYPIMLVGAVLLVAAVALLLIATKRRVDQKRTSEKAYDHLERAKRRDYVAPNEEEAEKPEPAPEAAPQTDDQPEADGDIELPHMKYVRDAYEHQGEYADDTYGAYDDETQPYPDDVMYGTGEEAPYDDGYYADGTQAADYGAQAQPGAYDQPADGTYDAAYDQPADGSYDAAYDQPADGSYDAAYDQPADGSYDAAYDQPADGSYDAAYDQPADGTYDATYDQPDDGVYEQPDDGAYADEPQAAQASSEADQPTSRRRRRSGKSSSAE